MQFIHRHPCRYRTERIDHHTIDQIAQFIALESAISQCLCSPGDGIFIRGDGDIKFSPNVNPKTVLRNQRGLTSTTDIQSQRLHVYTTNFVEVRYCYDPTVNDHTTPTDPSSD